VTGPPPGLRGLVEGTIVVVSILAAATVWGLGDRSAASLIELAAAMAGAAAVLIRGRDHPVLAVAIVFALASASRLVVETPVGTLRLEQPAIAALVVVAAARVRREGLHAPRQIWVIGAAVLVYLVVMTMSSAFVAPQPIASLRMTLWWTISAAGGGAAFILLRERTRAGRDAFVAVGTGFAVVGIIVAVIFGIAGPDVAPGIQEALAVQPRVFGVGWEANLYASYLAAILVLAVGAAGGRRGIIVGAVALLGIAFPLGVTRGAYLGLAAGTLSMGAIIAWRVRRRTFRVPRALISIVGVGTVALAVGFLGVGLLLPNIDQRVDREQAAASPSPTPVALPGSSPLPAASPLPLPSMAPAADTVGFRLARVGPAMEDFRLSPIVGLGAESFGQRHADATQGGAPDHLPFLILAVPYETGVVGTAALLLTLLLILWGLIGRTRGTRPILPASLVGAIVSLLVAYEATNALHFAANWLLLGLAMAVAWGRDEAMTAEPTPWGGRFPSRPPATSGGRGSRSEIHESQPRSHDEPSVLARIGERARSGRRRGPRGTRGS
jgi:O-Antigen ligase